MDQGIYPSYTALLGGSFDPFHLGHLHIARCILELSAVSRVVFLPSGKHNFKADTIHLSFVKRLELIQQAIKGETAMEVWDEDSADKGSGYTADLMKRLYQKHPNTPFCFVIGSDNLAKLSQWKHFEWLCPNVEFLLLPRPDYDHNHEVTKLLKLKSLAIPLCSISSSDIRSKIAGGHSIKGLVPEVIMDDCVRLYGV